MPHFNSSAIKRAEYDQAAGRLTIWFSDGKPYDFCRVPLEVYQGFCNANSKGRYYHERIEGRYHC